VPATAHEYGDVDEVAHRGADLHAIPLHVAAERGPSAYNDWIAPLSKHIGIRSSGAASAAMDRLVIEPSQVCRPFVVREPLLQQPPKTIERQVARDCHSIIMEYGRCFRRVDNQVSVPIRRHYAVVK
jgi:hypothetical protein